MTHPNESQLALFAGRDLPWADRLNVGWHLYRCASCKRRVEDYREDRLRVRRAADSIPANVDWDHLAGEMSANIRVGLAAGECVAPKKTETRLSWQPVLAMAGLFIVLAGILWVNLPHTQTAATPVVSTVYDSGPIVEATDRGIELKANGSALAVTQGAARPVAVTVSLQGSARARYVDGDTGQITITSVYAQ